MSPNPGVLTHEQFPCPPGNLPWTVADIAGPAAYVQVVTGTPPTGGQAVGIAALGLSVSVITAYALGSDDGTYRIDVLMNPFVPKRGSTTGIILRWIVISTGLEVAANVNLSARTVRVHAVGR